MKLKVLTTLKDSAICPIDLEPFIREFEVQYYKGKNRMKLKRFLGTPTRWAAALRAG